MSDAETQWDKYLGDALRLVTAGVDPDVGSETVADALAALAKQAKALRAVEYSGAKTKRITCVQCSHTWDVELPAPEALAKTMAHTAKMIDEIARLVQFVSGKPDSRPELAGMDWLRCLTSDQVAQVQQWVQEAERAEARHVDQSSLVDPAG